MSDVIYHMPLEQAISQFNMLELVKIFSKTHPSFLAAIVKKKANLESF